MREFNTPDGEFFSHVARWVFDSAATMAKYKEKQKSNSNFGKSGGKTSCDGSENMELFPRISFKPFVTVSLKKPSGVWDKQKGFETVKPLLSTVITAYRMGSRLEGAEFKEVVEGMVNWYRIGLEDHIWMKPAVEKLASQKFPLWLYGRDCLPLHRALVGARTAPMTYYEGLSRVVLDASAAKEVLPNYLKNIGQLSNIPSTVIHVDTGFSGSIPRKICNIIKKDLGTLPAHTMMMLSANDAQWGLGCSRDLVLKNEYRPKLFFRAHEWDTSNPKAPMPKMHVSGDAHFAAAYLVGMTAARNLTTK